MQVTFESEHFPAKPGEDEHTNPGRFGRSLATWMQLQLANRGHTYSEVVEEDFGWIVVVSRKPQLLWLACANIEGSPREWSMFPAAEASLKQRLFDRPNVRGALDTLWSDVQAIVPSIPQVKNITWA